MPTLADFDAAMLQVGRSVPAVQRLGGGTIALAGPRQPWRVVGQTAVVYQLNQPSGSALALRCPIGDPEVIDPVLGERYRALASDPAVAPLRRSGGPLLGGLVYFPEGLSLAAGEFRSISHPVMVMEWVKGPTLLAAVDRACREEETEVLAALAEAWVGAIGRLAQAGFTHGDLVADNVMIRPSGGIALVDYDTCSWPEAPATRRSASGAPIQAGIEALPPGYAHPSGAVPPLAHRDDFPALVIYISLHLLGRWPRLRRQAGDRPGTNGGVLLFAGADLADPARSQLVRSIHGLEDPVATRLLTTLLRAAEGPISAVPPLPEAVAELRMSSSRAGTERGSRAAWQPERLATRADAWPSVPNRSQPPDRGREWERERVDLAPTELLPALERPGRPRQAADWNVPARPRGGGGGDSNYRLEPGDPLERQLQLTRLNSLLLAGDEAAAERFWHESGLATDREAVRELGTRIGDIRRRRILDEARAAVEAGDAEAFVRSWNEGGLDHYQPAASLRPLVESARRRSNGPEQLRSALKAKDIAAVVRLWPEVRTDPRAAPEAVRVHALIGEHVGAAIAAARRRDDDDALVLAVREADEVGIAVDETARRAARAARDRIETRAALRAALAVNDQTMLASLSLSGRLADLGPIEPAVGRAVKRAMAWPHLERALHADDDAEIRATYTELFDEPGALTPEQRARVELARLRLGWLEQVRRAIKNRDTRTLRTALGKPPPGAEGFLTRVERTRIGRLTAEG